MLCAAYFEYADNFFISGVRFFFFYPLYIMKEKNRRTLRQRKEAVPIPGYWNTADGEIDQLKVEQLYLRYRGMMFYVAMGILRDGPNAEDAVHQAFLSILENVEKLPEIESPKTQAYVITVTERKAIDIIREERNYVEAEMDRLERGFQDPVGSGLGEALERLPARYREVMLLRYEQGYDTKEIGRMLDIKQESAEKLLWRAKTRLRRIMEEEG